MLKDNLVSHIEFEETSGNFSDSHGSAIFVRRADATHATGKIGNSLTLDGTGDFSDYSDETDWRPGDQDFAIGCWVRLDAGGKAQCFVSKYDTTGNNREYLLGVDASNNVVFYVSGDGTSGNTTTLTESSFGALSTGVWYYIFAYHDATNDLIGVSVNAGTRDTTSHTIGCYASGTSDICVGRLESAIWYLEGDIDELSYWEGGIPSTSDVSEIYNSGSGLAFSSWDASDTTPPTLSSAVVPSAGTTLVLTYDENVTATDESGFNLDSDGGSVTLSGLSGDGTDTHTYTLSRTVLDTETLNVDYDSGAGSAVDDASNDLASFTDIAVTNNSSQTGAPPTLSSASVNAAGTTLTLNFTGNVTATDADGFELDSDYGRLYLSGLSGDGTSTLTYTIQRAVYGAETLTLSYHTVTGSANLDDISGESVTNNSTQTEADQVYVSPSGDDANDGTSAGQAVLTMTRAAALWSSNNNSGSVLFERGGEWTETDFAWTIGQGSAAHPLARLAAYGSGADPVLNGVRFLNTGSGLYDFTVSDLEFVGDGVATESNDCFRLTRIVGTDTVQNFRNVTIRGWSKGMNLDPFTTAGGYVVLSNCTIRDNASIGGLFQEIGYVEAHGCLISQNALGSTPRTHAQTTHGLYASSCYAVTVRDNIFNDNGSMGLKCSSDYTDRTQPVVITGNVFIDGFFAIGLDASDVADIGAGNVRHRDATITGNAILRTRDINTSRRVDFADSPATTRDYWDRLVWVHACDSLVAKHNAVYAIPSANVDNALSEADNFVFFETDQYHNNNQVGSNELQNVGAEYNSEATTVSEANTADPIMLVAVIYPEGDACTLMFNRSVTGQTAFSLSASGGAVTLTSGSGDGTAAHRYSLSRTVYEDETVTISYDSGSGSSVDSDSTALPSFTDVAVINNSTEASSSQSSSGVARVVGYDVAGNVAFDVSGPPWLLTQA